MKNHKTDYRMNKKKTKSLVEKEKSYKIARDFLESKVENSRYDKPQIN